MKKDNQLKESVSSKKSNPKPPKGKKILIVVLVLILVLVTVFVLAAMRVRLQVKNSEHIVPEQLEENEMEQLEENEVEQLEGSKLEVVEKPNETETKDEELVVEEDIFDYDNKLIGIKFNYATEMYIKESTDTVFNTLKSVSESGKNFRIGKDKLTELLPILQLTTGKSDGLVITVSLIPFEMTGDDMEIEGGIPEITEDNLKEYDTKLKDSLKEMGVDIDIFEDSYIKGTNGLKAIISERRYSGSLETSTGVVDVIQGVIPVGLNAVLVTAITDGSPIEIDKVELFNEIIESMVVTLTPSDVEEGGVID